MLASFSSGEFLLKSRAGFIFMWGVCLAHPMLIFFFFFFFFPLGSFFYTSRAGFIFMRGVSLTHSVLSHSRSFSYTSHAGFFSYFYYYYYYYYYYLFFLIWGFLLHIACSFPFYIGWVSLTHTVLASCLSREFLLHLPYRLKFHGGSSSYTSHAGLTFLWGVSLTHPMLAFFLSFFNLRSFSYKSRDGFIFIWGLSLTHPELTFVMWGVSPTHPVLPSVLCGEFVLHIPCCLDLYARCFSYTSRAGFVFFFFFFLILGVSLTHPVLSSLLCGEFLLHILCCLHFYVGSFSYTSRAVFTSMWGLSLTHPVLTSSLRRTHLVLAFFFFFLCEDLFSSADYSENNPLKKELGGSWPRRKVWKSHTQTREGSPRTAWTEQNKTKQELSLKVGTGMKGEKKKWIWALNKP